MNNQDIDRVSDLIAKAQKIAIVLGDNPSVDEAAAGLAFYLSLTKAGRKVQITSSTAPTVELGNLVGIDKLKQFTSGTGATGHGFVISLPYQQGAIEKISYDIIGERINLTVVPGPSGLGFTTDDITYNTPSQNVDVTFAIGVPAQRNSEQGDGMTIDESLDPASSSLSEIVTNLLLDLNLPLDIDIAQNLLSGIVDKTDNFQSKNASSSAFETAALLMQKGARRSQLPRRTPLQNTQGSPWGTRGYPQDSDMDMLSPSAVLPQRRSVSSGGPAPFQPAMPKQSFNSKLPRNPKDHTQAGGNTPHEQGKAPAKAPKNWFEPRIYKGSTPVS